MHKTLFIAGLLLFLNLFLFAEKTIYFSLSEFSRNHNYLVKYNMTLGYADLSSGISSESKSLRLYLTMPYIVSAGNIYYLSRKTMLNNKGDIEISMDTMSIIEKILGQVKKGNVSTSQVLEKKEALPGEHILNQAQLEQMQENTSSTSKSSGPEKEKIEKSESALPELLGKDNFIPINAIVIDPGHEEKTREVWV